MSYHVGIDLGTTYTAAATYKESRAEIFSLGQDKSAIPSLVLLNDSGEFLTGDAAARKAVSKPESLAREFKRRLGDTTPIILDGSPFTAETLTAELLKKTIEKIESQEGTSPERITITHPANWGDFKRNLLLQIAETAAINPKKVTLLSEPEAAAIYYSCNEKLAIGEKIAVYDLGGGTFDTSILERTEKSFKILGKPEGIERLGGVDFDAALFAHVTQLLGDELAELDYEDPASIKAVARLKQDCLEAKEALSSDTDTIVPVLLPNLQTEIRITRREFENLCKTALESTFEALRRALDSAQISPKELTKILLVGGSSKIPVVAQLLTTEFGVAIAVDSHPKHSIALGAALYAGKATLLHKPKEAKNQTSPSPSPENAARIKEPGSQPAVPLSVPLTKVPVFSVTQKQDPSEKTGPKKQDDKKKIPTPITAPPATKIYTPKLAATQIQPATRLQANTKYAQEGNTIQNADFKQVRQQGRTERPQKSRIGILVTLAGFVVLLGTFIFLNKDSIFSNTSADPSSSTAEPASPVVNQETTTSIPTEGAPVPTSWGQTSIAQEPVGTDPVTDPIDPINPVDPIDPDPVTDPDPTTDPDPVTDPDADADPDPDPVTDPDPDPDPVTDPDPTTDPEPTTDTTTTTDPEPADTTTTSTSTTFDFGPLID